MCFCRRKKCDELRKDAGKCRSMEIDEGPPPFCGVVDVDDSYDKSEQHEYDDVDDSPDSTSLPLPSASRSRSVTPVKDTAAGHEEAQAIPEASGNNDKGDTMATALSQDEFTGFQNSEKENSDIQKEEDDDDDEWGDFGEAVAAAPIQARPQSPPPSLKMDGYNNDDDDDDWGAFDQARPSTDRTESGPNSTRSQEARQQSLDEWGAFENSNNLEAADDEWQAEFSSASEAPPPPPQDTVLENFELLDEMLENVEFWHDGFQEECREEEESPEMNVVDIPALFDSENLVEMANSFEVEEKQRHSRLWLSLRLVEEAISLKFDWNNSEIRKNHLKSLKINPVTAKKEPRSMNSFFDTSNLLLPTPIQATTTTSSSTESAHDSSSATAINQKTSSSSPPSSITDSPSVPAVDFDWDTSGLTNPMNRANQSSAIIDVDFLGSNGVATAYTSTLQKDLEHFGLTNGGSKALSASNGPNIFETIMSGSGAASSSNSRYRTTEVLSLDAQKLLEKLPDLQYLQSGVLMFPIGTNLPH